MELLDRVKKLYKDNHKVGELHGVHYDYTCPSPKMWYPHQWIWDSCFHSIVLTHFDIERAKREMKTLLNSQRNDGFIPCCTLWQKRFPFEEMFYITKITQPPVIPLAAEIIYKKSHDLNFVSELYPKLKAFMDWLADNRDKNKNSLLEIIHPWEAGCDSIPSFDKQMGIINAKPSVLENFSALFRVLIKYYFMGWNEEKIYESKLFINECVLFNSIYAKSLLSMVFLAKELNKDEDSSVFAQKYKKTKQALMNLCWSESDQIFYDLNQDGQQIKVKTISSLMPLILPGLPEKIVQPLIEKHLLNEKEFWTPVPIASVPLTEKTFNPNGGFILWRGPMWVNTNWFLTKALKNYGYEKEASYVISKTVETIDKYGFWEYYNSFTGEGYGQPTFGWSTLVLNMI